MHHKLNEIIIKKAELPKLNTHRMLSITLVYIRFRSSAFLWVFMTH